MGGDGKFYLRPGLFGGWEIREQDGNVTGFPPTELVVCLRWARFHRFFAFSLLAFDERVSAIFYSFSGNLRVIGILRKLARDQPYFRAGPSCFH